MTIDRAMEADIRRLVFAEHWKTLLLPFPNAVFPTEFEARHQRTR